MRSGSAMGVILTPLVQGIPIRTAASPSGKRLRRPEAAAKPAAEVPGGEAPDLTVEVPAAEDIVDLADAEEPLDKA